MSGKDVCKEKLVKIRVNTKSSPSFTVEVSLPSDSEEVVEKWIYNNLKNVTSWGTVCSVSR